MTDPIILKILDRKRQGIDCTESESAELKQWLKELKLPNEQSTVAEIQSLFPQEYEEYLRDEYTPDQEDLDILTVIANNIGLQTACSINQEVSKIKGKIKFPYPTQFVLEEVIKMLEAAV